jgi:hypothetical protein
VGPHVDLQAGGAAKHLQHQDRSAGGRQHNGSAYAAPFGPWDLFWQIIILKLYILTKLTVPIGAEGTGPGKALIRTWYWVEQGTGKGMVLCRAGHRAGHGHGQGMARGRAWRWAGHLTGEGMTVGKAWHRAGAVLRGNRISYVEQAISHVLLCPFR